MKRFFVILITSLLYRDSLGQDEHNPVFVMGLPRSGSESIHQFFECQGLSSNHYYCCSDTDASNCRQTCGQCIHSNLNSSKPMFENCGSSPDIWSSFDVEVQEPFVWFLPQSFLLPIIHQEYPESVWILNTRESPERWGKQIRHWHTVSTRILHSFGREYSEGEQNLQYFPTKQINDPDEVVIEFQKSLEKSQDKKEHQRRLDDLVEIHENHQRKIREFALQHGHQLIEINVDDPSSAEEMLRTNFELRKSGCWSFDGEALDNDFLDFTSKQV